MNDMNSELRRARDALDDIDEAVAAITDDDIEDRLQETLRRALTIPPRPARTYRQTRGDRSDVAAPLSTSER
jgi:hypothetical protein